MASMNKDLLYTILQFLKEQNLMDTVHSLEREAGCFFDLKYFESLVIDGRLDEAEKYLAGFTHVHENMYSTRIFFELRKQKFLEALDMHDRGKALDILMKDFKDFKPYNETLYKDATMLLTLDDFRKHGALAKYGDSKAERRFMMNALRKFLSENPAIKGKTQPPVSRYSSFLHLVLQRAAGTSSSFPMGNY